MWRLAHDLRGVGLLALATAIACGKSERSKTSPGPTTVDAGVGGVPERAGAGGSDDAPVAAGAPAQAGADGEIAGAAGAGGATDALALLRVADDITITREIQADSDYFYIVLHPAPPTNEPGDIVRLAIGGGSPEVLVQDVGGKQADLQLYAGVLYYKSDIEIRAYDLSTGTDTAVVSLSEINDAVEFTSFKAGPGGVYWITDYDRHLRRRSAPSAAIETLETPVQVYQVLKVEAEQVLVTQAVLPFMLTIYDLATQGQGQLATYEPTPFVSLPIDDQAYYYWAQPEADLLLQRAQRSDAVPVEQGYYQAPTTTLTEWQAHPESNLLLFEQSLLVRMDDDVWYAVSTADGASKALPELSACVFLFSGEEALFCSTGEAFGTDVYRVSPALLAP